MATAPVWKANGTAVSGTGSFNLAWPAGHAAGDFGIIIINSSNEASSASGWTFHAQNGIGVAATADSTMLRIYYKFATSSAEPDVLIGDSGNHTLAVMITFTGVNTDVPIAGGANSWSDVNTTAVTYPTLTTTTANALICLLLATGQEATQSGWTHAGLTGLTARASGTTTSGLDGSVASATGLRAVAGATGTGSSTASISSKFTSHALALNPVDYDKIISGTVNFGIPTAAAFGNATVDAPSGPSPQTVTLTAGIAGAEAFGVAVVGGGLTAILPSGIAGAEAFGTTFIWNRPAPSSLMKLSHWRGDGDRAQKVRAALMPGASTAPIFFFRYTDMGSVSGTTSGNRTVSEFQHGYADSNSGKFHTYNFSKKASGYVWTESEAGDNLSTVYGTNGVNFYQYSLLQESLAKIYKRIEYTGDGVSGRLLAHGLDGTPVAVCADGIWAFAGDTTKTWLLPPSGTGATYATTFTAAPDATNITLAASSRNANGVAYVMNCFTDGGANLCATGTYVGNGGAQSVALGMKPRMVILFRTDVATHGVVFDQMRGGGDPDRLTAIALGYGNHSSINGGIRRSAQVLSTATGFDVVTTSPLVNANGGTYRWLAFRYVDADISALSIPSAETFGRPMIAGGAERSADQAWLPVNADDAWKDEAYYLQYAAEGATGPYTYAVTSGALPTGLTLTSAGLLSGSTTANGTYSFTVTVTPAAGTALSKAQSIVVADMPKMFDIFEFEGDGTGSRVFTHGVDLTSGGRVVVDREDASIVVFVSEDGSTWYSRDMTTVSGDVLSTSTFGNGTMTLVCGGAHNAPNSSGFLIRVSILRNHPKAYMVKRYTGNGAAARTVAHGLETTPVLITQHVASFAANEAPTQGQADNDGWSWHAGVGPTGIFNGGRRLPVTLFGPDGPDAANITLGSGADANGNYSGEVYYLSAFAGGNPNEHRSLVATGFAPFNNAVEAPSTTNQRHFDVPAFPRWFATELLLSLQMADDGPDTSQSNFSPGRRAYTIPYLTEGFPPSPPLPRLANLRLGTTGGGSGYSQSEVETGYYAATPASGEYSSRVGGVCPTRTSTAATFAFDTFLVAIRGSAATETGQGVTLTTAIDGAEAFGTLNIANTTTVAPTAISGEEALGTPLVVSVVSPAGIASEEVFGVLDVIGNTELAPSAIPSEELFGTATVANLSGEQPLFPAGLASEEAFGTPLLTSVVAASGIAGEEAFGSPQLNLFVTATGVASAEAFGTAQLVYNQTVAVTGIASAEAFGTPSGGIRQTVRCTGIVTAAAVGACRVARVPAIYLPPSIVSQEGLGTPDVFIGMKAFAIDSIEAFGEPRLSRRFDVPSLGDGGALGEPRVSAILSPVGIASEQSLGAASVSQRIYIDSAIYEGALGTPHVQFVVSPSSVSSFESFGVHEVITRQILYPTSIASEQALGTATVLRGARSIGMQAVSSAELFGLAKLSLALFMAAIDSVEQLGDAVVSTGPVEILPLGFSDEVVGSPIIVVGGVVVSLVGIASEETVNEHVVTHSYAQQIYVGGIPGAGALGYPVVSGGCETAIIVVVRSVPAPTTITVGEC